MSRTQRRTVPPNSGGKEEKVQQLRRQNHQLQKVTMRQRRSLKELRAVLMNARLALRDDNLLRAIALLDINLKHPPSEVTDCNHDWVHKYVHICNNCKEVYNGKG